MYRLKNLQDQHKKKITNKDKEVTSYQEITYSTLLELHEALLEFITMLTGNLYQLVKCQSIFEDIYLFTYL